jgi:hypothetical protein
MKEKLRALYKELQVQPKEIRADEADEQVEKDDEKRVEKKVEKRVEKNEQ